MSDIRLSIIVPIYNVAPYLRQCIDSLLAQELMNFEVILVNDGSTDNSPDIAQHYVNKFPGIIKLHSQDNQGLPSARNAGLTLAKGQYVYMPDADDYLLPGKLNGLLSCAIETGADVVGGNCYNLYDNGVAKENMKFTSSTGESGKQYLTKNLNKKKSFSASVWTKIYSRQHLINNNITFHETVKTSQDLLFNIEVYLVAKKVIFINDRFYCYRKKRPGSLTCCGKNERRINAISSHIQISDRLMGLIADGSIPDMTAIELNKKAVEQLLKAARLTHGLTNNDSITCYSAQIMKRLNRIYTQKITGSFKTRIHSLLAQHYPKLLFNLLR